GFVVVVQVRVEQRSCVRRGRGAGGGRLRERERRRDEHGEERAEYGATAGGGDRHAGLLGRQGSHAHHLRASAASSAASSQRHSPGPRPSRPIGPNATRASESTRLPTAATMRLTWWYLPSVSVSTRPRSPFASHAAARTVASSSRSSTPLRSRSICVVSTGCR